MRFFFYGGLSIFKEMMMHVYKIMYSNSKTTDEYYGIGNRIRLSEEVLPVKIK